MSLGHVSTVQAVRVWSELEAAYHGINGFGGNTAEIYVYTLLPNDPSGSESMKAIRIANLALFELLVLFHELHEDAQIFYNATRTSDGLPIQWSFFSNAGGFTDQDHRHHIRMLRSIPNSYRKTDDARRAARAQMSSRPWPSLRTAVGQHGRGHMAAWLKERRPLRWRSSTSTRATTRVCSTSSGRTGRSTRNRSCPRWASSCP